MMSSFDDKRRQIQQEALLRVESLLPGSSAQDRHNFVEKLDRTAYEACGGSEEDYEQKVRSKLQNVQRKLEKKALAEQSMMSAQTQPNMPLQSGQELQQAPNGMHGQMARSGSSQSGGSVRGMTHQHDQLMRKQQQQALMSSQQQQQQQQYQQQYQQQQQQQQHANLGMMQQPRFVHSSAPTQMQSSWQTQPRMHARPQPLQHQQYSQMNPQPRQMAYQQSNQQRAHRPLQQPQQQQHHHQMAQQQPPQLGRQHHPQMQQQYQNQGQQKQVHDSNFTQQNPFKQLPQQQLPTGFGLRTNNPGVQSRPNQQLQNQVAQPQTSNPFHMPEYRQSLFEQQNTKPPAPVNVPQQPAFKQEASDPDDHFHASPSMKQMIHSFLLDTEGNTEMAPFASQDQKQAMAQAWAPEQNRPQMPHNQPPRLAMAGHRPMAHVKQEQQWPSTPHFPDQRMGGPSNNAHSYPKPAGQNPSLARSGGQNTFNNPSASHVQYSNSSNATAGYAQPPNKGSDPQNPSGNPNHGSQASGFPRNSLANGMDHGSPFAALSSPLPSPLQAQPQRQQQQQPPVNKPLPWMTQQQQAVPQQPAKEPSRPPSAGTFMGMLTDGDNTASQNPLANNRQPSPFQAAMPTIPPAANGHMQLDGNNQQPAFQRPARGSPEDYTVKYWDLLRKVQKDMVPVFEKFRTTIDRLTDQQKGEKLMKKVIGIYNILPRLKIQPTDAQYRGRVWTKQEYDQLQQILKQLYPYCIKLNQVGAANAGGQSNNKNPGSVSSADTSISGQSLPQGATPQSTSTPQAFLPQPYENSYGNNQQQSTQFQHPLQGNLQEVPVIQPLAAQEGDLSHESFAGPPPADPFAPHIDIKQEVGASGEPKAVQDRVTSAVAALQSQGVSDVQGTDQTLRELQESFLNDEAPKQPPKHLLPPEADSYYHVKLGGKRKLAGDVDELGDRYSPTSVLDPFPDEPVQKKLAVDPSLAKARAALEEDCWQVTNERGSDLLLRVAGGDATRNQLVVHIAPNCPPFTDLEDSVQLPEWLAERWKVLTLKIASSEGPENTQSGNSPEFLFHFGPGDCLAFDKADRTRQHMENCLRSSQQTLQLKDAVKAWAEALLLVNGSPQE